MPENLRARATLACCSAALTVALPILATAAEYGETQHPSWTFDDLRPTVTSADGRFSMSVRARLQLDSGDFDQAGDVNDVTPFNDVEFKHLNSGVIARRAYLGVEGWAFGDFWYEYRMNFGGAGSKLADPYIHIARISYNLGSYDGGPLFRVNAGLIKPILTYNDATSSASLTFLERAAVVNVATETFGGGAPRLGAEVTFQQTNLLLGGDNLVVSAALTGHIASKRASEISRDANSNGTHLLGRIAYRLWSDGLSNIQMGGSFSQVLKVGGAAGPGGARSLSLQDQPEIQIDDNALVDTGPLPAKGGTLWGVETAANLKSVYIAAEYYHFTIERDTICGGCTAATDPQFSGWYVEASWMLTGETKTYQANAMNNGMATFANPRVKAPLAPHRRSWGAWEIAARYSELDLNWRRGTLGTICPLGCVRGGEQESFAIGLNWYLSNNFRVLFDYMVVKVDKLSVSGAQIGQSFNAVGTRFQFTN